MPSISGWNDRPNKFLEKIEGQFSIAFLNKDKNTLTLIRDRLGQKPLYYYHKNNT